MAYLPKYSNADPIHSRDGCTEYLHKCGNQKNFRKIGVMLSSFSFSRKVIRKRVKIIGVSASSTLQLKCSQFSFCVDLSNNATYAHDQTKEDSVQVEAEPIKSSHYAGFSSTDTPFSSPPSSASSTSLRHSIRLIAKDCGGLCKPMECPRKSTTSSMHITGQREARFVATARNQTTSTSNQE